MRIRSTKPEFWRSVTISELSLEERLILKALESYVDDNGVGKDSVVMIAADAFPHDLAKSSEICAKISRSLGKFSEADLIVRYSVAGEALIYVRQWKRLQYIDKPKTGRYPRPDGTKEYRDAVDESIGAGQGVTDSEVTTKLPENCAKSSRKPREDCPQIQSGEQRNRGTEEQEEQETCATALRDLPLSPSTSKFAEFWAAYPRRRDRRKAEKAFTAALKRADADTIIAGAHRYAQDRNRQEQFTKYAEGWLNGDGWLDEPLPDRSDPATNGQPAHKLRTGVELAARVRAEEQRAALANQTLKELE